MKNYEISFELQDGTFYKKAFSGETHVHAQAKAVREVGAQWLGVDVVMQKNGFIGEIFAVEVK